MKTTIPRLAPLAVLLALAACGSGGADGGLPGAGLPRSLRVAEAAMAGGLPQAALNATNAALERDPGNVQALLQQGDALTALGRGEAAKEAYRRVLERGGGGAQVRRAQLGMGRAELAAGRMVQAEAAYRQVLAIAPEDTGAHDGLGIALDLQGRHREAQSEYRLALARKDDDGTRVNLGLSLAISGDASEAVSVLGPLARNPAASRRVRHNLAFALALAGDRPAAERILAPDMAQEQVRIAMSGYAAFLQP